MLGSHLSISGSMVNALREAEMLGFDTVQVFSKNQQQWAAKPLDAGMVREWNAEVQRLGWDRGCPDGKGGLTRGRIVCHASYLINLASVNPELWRKSVDSMVHEVERCADLGIEYLVHHPGSFVGGTIEDGIANIARAYTEIVARTTGMTVTLCLEGTTGSGSHLGGPMEHLATLRERIIEATGEPRRVGFCLDTCHLHAAGHDLSTRAAAKATLAKFDQLCGLQHLHAFHLNDSKGKLGSKLDRHAEIGEGEVGGAVGAGVSRESLQACGFAEVMGHPALRDTPKILETPKGLRVGGEWIPGGGVGSGAKSSKAPPAGASRAGVGKPSKSGKSAASGPDLVANDVVNVNRLRWLAGLELLPAPREAGPTALSASKESAKVAEVEAPRRTTKVGKPRQSARPKGKGKASAGGPRRPGRSSR